MRDQGLGGGLLRRPDSNLLVVAGPRLELGWRALLGQGRRGTARLCANCRAPAVSREAATGMLLSGELPSASAPASSFRQLAVPHLGHLLAATHFRLALLAGEDATGLAGSRFAAGFSELRTLDAAGDPLEALRGAAERAAAVSRRAARPWFLFAHLPDDRRLLPGLAALMATHVGRRTALVVYDPGEAASGAGRRTPLWVEHPGRSAAIDPEGVLYPHLVSPLDLLATLLADAVPPSPFARSLDERGGTLRPDLLAATFAADPGAADRELASWVLRLGEAGKDRPPGRFEPVTFVVAVDDPAQLQGNLLRCPVSRHDEHEWLLVDNTRGDYAGISRLYDDAWGRARHDLVLFCHQDLFLLDDWGRRFFSALGELEREDPDWGVVGSVGVAPPAAAGRRRRVSRLRGHWVDPRGHHYAGPLPHPVQSLDEMWLGVRRSTGVRFDRDLPGFHCYGMDLSLTARASGRRSYALDCLVWHKHRDGEGRIITRPQESDRIRRRADDDFHRRYAVSYDYVAAKWGHCLPFSSTSADWPAAAARPERSSGGGAETTGFSVGSSPPGFGQNGPDASREGRR